MAKKKKESSSIKRLVEAEKRFYLRHKIIGTILIILAAWILIWLGQVGLERYNFYQAASKVKNLSSDLYSDISYSNNRYCIYSSVPYGRGTLRCSVYTNKTIPVRSVEAANGKVKEYMDKINTSNLIDKGSIYKNKKESFTEEDFINGGSLNEIRYEWKFIHLKMGCSFIMRPSTEEAKLINLSIGCTKKSKYPYFPVKN